MSDFKSYWYVCTSCDASIEVVSKGIHFQDPTCNCNNSQVVHCQTNVVKSAPTIERNEMQIVTHDSYLPHQLVTLKQITGEEVEFQLYKVTDLEVVLHDAKQRINSLTARLESQEKQIGLILDKLTADEWYSSSTDKAEVLSDLCDILGHEPKQTIRIIANVEIEVDYDCPLDEIEDFDSADFLQDVLTIDTYHGDAIIHSYNVDSADWATS